MADPEKREEVMAELTKQLDPAEQQVRPCAHSGRPLGRLAGWLVGPFCLIIARTPVSRILTHTMYEQKMKRLMAGDPELIEEAAANLAEAFASAGQEVRLHLTL